jgi:predicted HicB family RNase H-like nuclease
MLKYKGYTGQVNFDADAEIFHGEVVDTRDVITFQSRQEKPDKPFSGKFILRLTPELHHRVYLMAMQSGKSLNAWIREVLKKAV